MKQKESIRTLKQELEDARATIEAQEQRLQKLQGKNPNWVGKATSELKVPVKGVAQERKERKAKLPKSPSWESSMGDKSQIPRPASADGYMRGRKLTRSVESHSSRSPSPTSGASQSEGPPLYFGGRWTAYRADVRKVNWYKKVQIPPDFMLCAFRCVILHVYPV